MAATNELFHQVYFVTSDSIYKFTIRAQENIRKIKKMSYITQETNLIGLIKYLVKYQRTRILVYVIRILLKLKLVQP